MALVSNLSRIAKERVWARRIFMCLSVVSVGCMGAGVAALGLTMFITDPSVEMELLAGAIAGSSGQKIFDIYSRRLFGRKTREDDNGEPPAHEGPEGYAQGDSDKE